MPRKLDITKVDPKLREFVQTVDILLEQRRRGSKRGGQKAWTLEEFYVEFPSFHDIRRGKVKRLPDRQNIEEIAKWLYCTREEYTRLLRSVGYASTEEYLEGEELEQVLLACRRVMRYVPMPSYIMTRDWMIRDWNEHLLALFGWDSDFVLSIPERTLNLLHVIFNPELRIRQRLAPFQGVWEQTAWRTTYGFFSSNLYSVNEPWHQRLIEELHGLPDLGEYWYQVTNEQIPPYFKTAHIDYVTEMEASNGKTLRFSSVFLHKGGVQYPQIVAYMPADQESRNIYAELGIPVPENWWGYKKAQEAANA